MEAALRRRLAGVADVSISQHEQRAEVTFLPGTAVFSPAEFRRAVGEADVEVITLNVRVCGVVDEYSGLRPSVNGRGPFVQLRGDVRPGSSICAMGLLDDGAERNELEVVIVEPRR